MEDDQTHIVGTCEYHGCEFTHFVAETHFQKKFIVYCMEFQGIRATVVETQVYDIGEI